MPTPAGLPSYDELPEAAAGGRSGWGLFGDDDSVGAVNLLTPERTAAAARLVRTGKVFPLDAPVDLFDPPIAGGRGVPRHRVIHRPGDIGFDDVLDNWFPQGGSQWDSLAHVGYARDAFYNGATEADILSGRRNTIEHWAKRGIAGRAVVLDVTAVGRVAHDRRAIVTVGDLDRALAHSGVSWQGGDIAVVHTGFAQWWAAASHRQRRATTRDASTPGLEPSEDVVRWLWDAGLAAVVCDTFALEAFPPQGATPTDFIHRLLIGQLGLAIGELWWTGDLAADCAADGVYEAFLTAAPMHVRGGIGSPANALAVK